MQRVSKQSTTSVRWYPSRGDFKTEAEFNAHRQAFDRIYALEDRLSRIAGVSGAEGGKGSFPANSLGSPLNSQVSGLNISGSPTADGQKLTWDAASGQLVWK